MPDIEKDNVNEDNVNEETKIETIEGEGDGNDIDSDTSDSGNPEEVETEEEEVEAETTRTCQGLFADYPIEDFTQSERFSDTYLKQKGLFKEEE